LNNIRYKKFLLILISIISLGPISSNALAKYNIDEIVNLYKFLHSNPELSWQEDKTASHLADILEADGYEVTRGVGKKGVVAILENGKGPTLMIRADMDALPVEEKTNLKYASKVRQINRFGKEVPVMHACGHDIHMSVLIGTAKNLISMKNSWSGTLMLVLQPAEEVGQGSLAMLEDGLFERFPRPDFNLALHVGGMGPAGTIGYQLGYAMANVDSVDIIVNGVGGHGAYPHTTIDPIVLASQIVLSLQTIVSRKIDPLEPAVVTVGSIHGGLKHNIISEEVRLQLTLRSYSDEVREKTIDEIKKIVKGLGIAAGLPESKMPKVLLKDEYTPALYNDPEFSRKVLSFISEEIGDENVSEISAVMGGEDFARYGRQDPKIPSLLFWLGGTSKEDWKKFQNNEIELVSIHSPFFAPDPKPTITTGIKAMSASALGLLK
jgi:hippurate hydrolase|tara:strand:- start:15425 stop:16735 length:1311 start_codon:yes stop_codon:yes gene_type:complete